LVVVVIVGPVVVVVVVILGPLELGPAVAVVGMEGNGSVSPPLSGVPRRELRFDEAMKAVERPMVVD